jgi:hypothetical protein
VKEWGAVTYTKFTEDEYLARLRGGVDILRAKLEEPRHVEAKTEQAKLIAYFMDRAVQLGEATCRVKTIPVALDIFLRVICDDFIRLYWIVQSEKNAADYAKRTISEMAKLVRASLEGGHARVRNTKTGRDATAAMLKVLPSFASPSKSTEQMAKDCGLEKIYVIPFRVTSFAVHGNSFKFPTLEGAEMVAFPAIIGFVNLVSAVADGYPDELPSAKEVLAMLGPRKGAIA